MMTWVTRCVIVAMTLTNVNGATTTVTIVTGANTTVIGATTTEL